MAYNKWKWVLAIPCMCAFAAIWRTSSGHVESKQLLRNMAAAGYNARKQLKRELVTPKYDNEETQHKLQTNNVTTFDMEVYILYDEHPEHIEWSLTDHTGAYVARHKSRPEDIGERMFVVPLIPGKYAFEVTDSFGDGLCCFGKSSGAYELIVNTKTLATGGEFGYSTGKIYINLYSSGYNKLVPFVEW